MAHSTKVLSVMTVVGVHGFLAIAMLKGGLLELPRWLLLYLILLAFYVALFTRRWLWLRHRRGALYRGLGDTAAMLFASMVMIFFKGVDLGLPRPVATGIRLVAAVTAAYFLYRVIVLPLEDEASQVQVDVPPSL